MRRRATRDRVVALLASTAYFCMLYHVYVVRLRRWDYLGFALGEFSTLTLWLCWGMATLPVLLMPVQINRFSAFVNWCLYFFLYVPAVLFPVLQGLRTDALFLSLALCAGFSLMALIPRARRRPIDLRLRPQTFQWAFGLLFVVLTVYSLAIFGGSISFADITDVYDQRTLAGDLATGTLAGYSTGWLSGCLNPLLIGIGLLYRQRIPFVIGALGQIFVYATFAMKSIVLSIVIIIVIYLLVLRKPGVTFHGIAVFSLASVALPLAIGLLLTEDSSVLYENISAIVFMRTYGMAGALTGTYYDFFSQNSQTLYSHISVVRNFITYPYVDSIGEVIGKSMGFEMNANANFFATDGIASAGLLGVVLIGAFAGLMFRFFDALIPRDNLRLACAAAVPNIISLSNSSFFTTLLTSGFFLLVLCCAAWRTPASMQPARPPVARAAVRGGKWRARLRVLPQPEPYPQT